MEAAKQAHLRERLVGALDRPLTPRPAAFAERLRTLAVRRQEPLPLRLVGPHAAEVLLPERLGPAFGDPDAQLRTAVEISTLELRPVDEPHGELEGELALLHATTSRVGAFTPAPAALEACFARALLAHPPGALVASDRRLAVAHDPSPRNSARATEASLSMKISAVARGASAGR